MWCSLFGLASLAKYAGFLVVTTKKYFLSSFPESENFRKSKTSRDNIGNMTVITEGTNWLSNHFRPVVLHHLSCWEMREHMVISFGFGFVEYLSQLRWPSSLERESLLPLRSQPKETLFSWWGPDFFSGYR